MLLTIEQVRTELEAEVRRLGSLKALALAIGVTPPFISQIIKGYKRPSPVVLHYLGMTQVTCYARVKKGA